MIHGGDVYSIYEAHPSMTDRLVDFSANISPLGMPEAIKTAAVRALSEAECYPDPKARSLTDAIIAFLLRTYGTALDRSCVVCGNGAADVIYRLVLALRPKRALLCAPTFAEYEEALALTDTALEFYSCAHPSLAVKDDICQAIHPGLDMMFLCNPNNPTGLITDAGLLQKLIQTARANGVFLVVDECFLDFTGQERTCSVIPKLSQNKHIFVLKSFTKMYAMAGLRLGYGLCTDAALMNRVRQCGQPWPVSVTASAAGEAALTLKAHPEKVRRLVARERRYLTDAFARLGIRFFDSQANYILLQIKKPPDFYEQMLARGIVVRRCGNYRNLDDTFYRVAVRSHEHNRRLIKALMEVTGSR